MLQRSYKSRFKEWLLGHHPYNTIFNYNWVNVHPMIRTFKDLKDIFHGRVVDLGAGASPYYDLIAPNVKSYIAVDHSFALRKYKKHNIEYIAGTINAIPLVSESIDVIFCSQVLCQVQNPQNALREIARILRPGGYAIISVPHISPIHSEPYDLYRFTPDGLGKIAGAAGLKTCDIFIQGHFFSSLALCLAMNLVLTPIVDDKPMRLLPWRQVLFAPLICFLNSIAWILDKLIPFNRTPVNFILVSMKMKV